MLSRSFIGVALWLIAISSLVHAQSPPAQQSGYTFHAGTRIVLTDVTVTDRKGSPVYGLRASDFQIFDNNKPQVLASFEEHTTTPVAPIEHASTSPDVYSNEFLLHLPPVLNIIVIDITNLDLPDQMYLYYEFNRFIKSLPAGQPLAIYWQSGASNLMLQSFTTDPELLLAAVRKAIPRFQPPDRGYYVDSDLITLQAIANDFAQYPGRKNILWFSGGSTLFLHPDPLAYADPDRLRSVYDALEADRIAIYPVDARGLSMASHIGQHMLMKDVADSTGGTAFYDSNGLDRIAAHWLDNGGSFYTLTYAPSDFRFDNKWHKVKVKLTGDSTGYTLSYRRGYFADGTTAVPRRGQEPRTLLLADGNTLATPDLRSIPLVFEARVERASPEAASSTSAAASPNMQPPKKRTIPYSIHYSLPADALVVRTVNGKPEIDVGVAVFAFNDQGSAETHLADRFAIKVQNQGNLHRQPTPRIPLDQQIDLHKGQKYLYLAAWDMTSGRLGTLQIALKVAAEPKTQKF